MVRGRREVDSAGKVSVGGGSCEPMVCELTRTDAEGARSTTSPIGLASGFILVREIIAVAYKSEMRERRLLE